MTYFIREFETINPKSGYTSKFNLLARCYVILDQLCYSVFILVYKKIEAILSYMLLFNHNVASFIWQTGQKWALLWPTFIFDITLEHFRHLCPFWLYAFNFTLELFSTASSITALLISTISLICSYSRLFAIVSGWI